ncbi:MAG: hypothetical protein COU07_02155 [Candidatus Harrisonbacteria bacterium CG10_big_fil_rev_8_21_14_0_10_40_38]|uniref:Uncharacterized protein n=1 Tax=Candidatus Harrisonbacteria bacterium CG10_big_fil_rev_8_21_14_0_10_40_38 TaxID=1974583 RepID=A0A2H0US49_9BACT|nr:MAG: hypothetical protein COU07_02155 [Candidatus Harrisonbacteria bacterium CG10_big_fil_rev_8_21_14_0_10_40_38]
MPRRGIKQFIYGVLYLSIFAAIIYYIYGYFFSFGTCFDNRRNQGEEQVDCGGPCVSCEIANLKPIEALPVKLVGSGNFTSALLGFKNPNTSFGASNFRYHVTFFDNTDTVVSDVVRDSFIYPGDIKTVVEAGVPISISGVSYAKAIIENQTWRPISEFSNPDTSIRSARIEQDSIFDGNKISITGLFVNREAVSLARADIYVAVYDRNDVLIGLSSTFIERISSFEERAFTAIVPISDVSAISTASVRVYADSVK